MEFADKTFIMAKRLKELRENYEDKESRENHKNKGLSHAKLSQKLREKYTIKISKDALIAYEAPEYHTRAGANDGMSARYLRCLADFYGVSADYILGMDVPPTPNMEERAVCEYTGLSEPAINFLRYLNKLSTSDYWSGFIYTPILFMNHLLGSPLDSRVGVAKMIILFCVACQHRYPRKKLREHLDVLDSFDYSSLPQGFTVIERRDYSDFALQETERYFSMIIRSLARAAEKKFQIETEEQDG